MIIRSTAKTSGSRSLVVESTKPEAVRFDNVHRFTKGWLDT